MSNPSDEKILIRVKILKQVAPGLRPGMVKWIKAEQARGMISKGSAVGYVPTIHDLEYRETECRPVIS